MRFFAMALPLTLLLSSAALAQQQKDKSAGDIAATPVRDVGVDEKKVPPILQKAAEEPYAAPGKGCAGIHSERAALNNVLGPDFGVNPSKNRSKAGHVASVGGSALAESIIPFRGLVREVSGAAKADREMSAAVTAGVARRGYLRGLASARGCAI